MDLLPFQRGFIKGAFAPGVRTAALSLPRGNGKSTLAAHLAHRALTPGDPLHQPGRESFMVAASIGQARRTVFAQLTAVLPAEGYRIASAANNNCSVTHLGSNTRLTVLGSDGKKAQGLISPPLVILDEPGSWDINGGALMWDAIETAAGKPGSSMRTVIVGTLAPLGLPGHWWHDMVVDGSAGARHVTALQGDPARWDDHNTIKRCNPLMWRFPDSRKVLLDERDAARRDSRLKARFLSYRLNLPTADTAAALLTVDDFQRACSRPVPDPEGRPVVGIDLGGGRSWSAAVAVWPSGRVEALAVAPGIPSLAEQEKRDLLPAGTYQKLVGTGRLRVAEGLRVQPPAQLVDMVRGWRPAAIVCDRFRLAELRDAQPPCEVVPRVTRWSDAAADIRSLRRMALDGPLCIAPSSRALLGHALSQARVVNDDAGNCRLSKKDPSGRTGRDDAAAALVLAAGLHDRRPVRRPVRHAIV